MQGTTISDHQLRLQGRIAGEAASEQKAANNQMRAIHPRRVNTYELSVYCVSAPDADPNAALEFLINVGEQIGASYPLVSFLRMVPVQDMRGAIFALMQIDPTGRALISILRSTDWWGKRLDEDADMRHLVSCFMVQALKTQDDSAFMEWIHEARARGWEISEPVLHGTTRILMSSGLFLEARTLHGGQFAPSDDDWAFLWSPPLAVIARIVDEVLTSLTEPIVQDEHRASLVSHLVKRSLGLINWDIGDDNESGMSQTWEVLSNAQDFLRLDLELRQDVYDTVLRHAEWDCILWGRVVDIACGAAHATREEIIQHGLSANAGLWNAATQAGDTSRSSELIRLAQMAVGSDSQNAMIGLLFAVDSALHELRSGNKNGLSRLEERDVPQLEEAEAILSQGIISQVSNNLSLRLWEVCLISAPGFPPLICMNRFFSSLLMGESGRDVPNEFWTLLLDRFTTRACRFNPIIDFLQKMMKCLVENELVNEAMRLAVLIATKHLRPEPHDSNFAFSQYHDSYSKLLVAVVEMPRELILERGTPAQKSNYESLPGSDM